MSKFISTGTLVYMGETTIESKNGREFTLVTIGDRDELQRHEFFKDKSCDTSLLKHGDNVEIELELHTVGYNQRWMLKSLKKV